MSLIIPKTCSMGSSKTGLVGTIGVTLLNPDGTVHTARATAGIYEIGGGCYGKNITYSDYWKGITLWDTGGASPVYAVDDYVEGIIDAIQIGLDEFQGIDGKCLISTDAQDLGSSLIVDAEDSVCDAILTGTYHNITNSLGRRIRELGIFAIESGTAQAGTSTSITLAATVNVSDNVLNRNLIVLTDNTGKGQTRSIAGYDNTTKICLVDYEWAVTPDNTTSYQVVPSNTPLVVDHGQAQAGSSTSITLHSTASTINNTYNNGILVIVGGTGKGQTRLITAYNGTTKVATIGSPVWVTIPDATSIYGIIPQGVSNTSNISTDALTQFQTEIADMVIEGTLTLKEALMVLFGALGGESDGAGTTTQHFRNRADTKNRITATVDEAGNRTSITLDLT